jgi:ABC-type transport system involved in multi-copper enzyme maturation permease subunit
MTWLAWRQQRAGALFAVAGTVAVVVLLVITHHLVVQHAGDGYRPLQDLRLLGTGLIGVPAFLGAFWGAPLLTREYEAGTHRFVWAQSVTRRRWLLTKLGVAAAVTATLTAVFSLMFTWWSQPLDRLGNRVGTANFGQRGIAPVAYALFGLALGALVGALMRRTLPAMAATLAGFFVVRFAFQSLVRAHLLATVTTPLPTGLFGGREGTTASAGGWILSTRTVDAAGHTLSPADVDNLVARCNPGQAASRVDSTACTNRVGLQDVVRWHPASQFWPLQLLESGIFVAMAALLALACVRVVSRRA